MLSNLTGLEAVFRLKNKLCKTEILLVIGIDHHLYSPQADILRSFCAMRL